MRALKLESLAFIRRGKLGKYAVLAAKTFNHGADTFFDMFQRLDYLGDALSGQILKIAGLENLDDLGAEFLYVANSSSSLAFS